MNRFVPSAVWHGAFVFALSAGCSFAASLELWSDKPADAGDAAFQVGDSRLIWEVAGKTSLEDLHLRELRTIPPVNEGLIESRDLGTVRIEWLDGDKPFSAYRRTWNIGDGVCTTTWKRGGAGFTTTVIGSEVDDVVIVHLRVDQPGALSFRVRLAGPGGREGKPAGRGELLLEGRTPDEEGEQFQTRAWSIPFESEVAPDAQSQIIRGEGEAMIVIAAATITAGKVAGALKKLGDAYDPGTEHPDLSKVWEGAYQAHVAKKRKLLNLGVPDPPQEPLVDPFGGTVIGPTLYLRDLIVAADAATLRLLPDLPKGWDNGTAKGILVKGGYLVDIEWKDRKPVNYEIHRTPGQPPQKVKVIADGKENEVEAK